MKAQKNEPPLTVTAAMSAERPYYPPLAEALLQEIRAWYQDPEHEEEFQAWLREREAENRGACAV